ncbi:hypothetical protein [Rhodopila sp.]|uniref:hypothetical protein n=1 Tax=Rhodopila sp. TaxID=2480087 RepID=UPI003D136532
MTFYKPFPFHLDAEEQATIRKMLTRKSFNPVEINMVKLLLGDLLQAAGAAR